MANKARCCKCGKGLGYWARNKTDPTKRFCRECDDGKIKGKR